MAGQQDKSGDDGHVLIVIFAGLIVFMLMATYLGPYLIKINLFLREIWLTIFTFVWERPLWMAALNAIETSQKEGWTGKGIERLSKDLRLPMFTILGSIFSYYLYLVYTSNPVSSLKRVHSRESLCRSEARIWPWITPILKLNLVEASIDNGAWAMAKKPLDFARKYRLLEGKMVKRERASKLFALQLGGLWDGPEKLPDYKKGLFACFIAHTCRNKPEAIAGLETMVLSIAAGKLDVGFADALIKKHYQDERIQTIVKKHAYVSTVLCATLAGARTSGVLPPSYFLWLRPINRGLWYALDCVGRRTYFTECAGVHAHYLAEQVAGVALERPFVETAVEGLEKALREIKFD